MGKYYQGKSREKALLLLENNPQLSQRLAQIPAYSLALIDQGAMSFETISLDVGFLWNTLRSQYPDRLKEITLPRYQLSGQDLQEVPAWCATVLAASLESEPTPGNRVWELLGENGQTLVTELAEKREVSLEDRQQLAGELNKLLTKPGLYDEDLFPPSSLDTASVALLEHFDQLDTAEQIPWINRQLLATSFPDTFSPPGSELATVLVWRTPENDPRLKIKSLNATEPFTVYLKAALVVGAVLAGPWIFYQVWGFVAAGLYPHEKSYVQIYGPISLGLFLLGAATAFFFVFEPVLKFLLGFNEMLGIDPDPRISEWIGFVLLLPLGFCISFQLPLVMLFLNRINIFSVETYVERWRIAVLVIFVISALLTPADPWSMMLMAVPLSILYGGGILLCKYMPTNAAPQYDEQESV